MQLRQEYLDRLFFSVPLSYGSMNHLSGETFFVTWMRRGRNVVITRN